MIPFVKFFSFTFSREAGTNMKSQAYTAMLFSIHGDVLTPRQKEFYDLYYNEDLSLAEIAENNGITREGVPDVIVRRRPTPTDLEDKTGLIKRFHAMRKQLQEVEAAAEGYSWPATPGTRIPIPRRVGPRTWTSPVRWRRSSPWHLKD